MKSSVPRSASASIEAHATARAPDAPGQDESLMPWRVALRARCLEIALQATARLMHAPTALQLMQDATVLESYALNGYREAAADRSPG